MSERREFDVVVVGATGHTGRLCALRLQELGLRVLLAGRSEAKLAAAAKALGSLPYATLDPAVPLRAASVLARASVVLSCAGPFAGQGTALVRACIAAKRPYLDISGELPYHAELDALSPTAEAAGVALVPCVGFDVVVSEVTAALAAARLGGSVDDVTLSLATNTTPSRGSLQTLWRGMRRDGYAFGVQAGALVPQGMGSTAWQAEFPAPVGRKSLVGLGLVELETLRRVLRPRTARTGIPAPVQFGLRWAAAFARWTQGRGWLPQQATRLVEALLARMPEGATPAQQAATQTWQHALVSGRNGRSVELCARVGDVGQWTAICAAACVAAELRRPADAGLRTPTEAWGATELATALQAAGMTLFERGAGGAWQQAAALR